MKESSNKISLKKIYATYMIFIGVLGQILYYAQAYKIFSSKSAADLSIVGFIAGFVSVSSWLIYGIILRDRPLILANIVACIGAITVVVGIIMYR